MLYEVITPYLCKMENEDRINAKSLVLRSGVRTILRDISFRFSLGESIAITGSSGSGKTSLGRLLAGQLTPTSGELVAPKELKCTMVTQQDNFLSLSGRRSTYYGQRYENQGMENSPTILGYLEKVAAKENLGQASSEVIASVMETMHIDYLSDRKLLQLSNGERKRTQLAAALLQKPDLMVLDQPFVGLDVDSRDKLTKLVQQQMEVGISFVIICSPKMIPAGISQVIDVITSYSIHYTKLYEERRCHNGTHLSYRS